MSKAWKSKYVLQLRKINFTINLILAFVLEFLVRVH